MINFLHECDLADLQNFPYCVIGSGAAGISLAVSLSRKGHKVLLLESGKRTDSPDKDAYTGYSTPPLPKTSEYRNQRFGGTTHLWGGRCVPFDPIDFQARNYVDNSEWPINYDDVANYYPEAMDYCDAGAADFSIGAFNANERKPMFEDLQSLQPDIIERIERYSLPTDFAKKYQHELASNKQVQVLLNARCIGINCNETGDKILSVNAHNGSESIEIFAENFIICAGGIETTRLMLLTQEKTPAWSRFANSLGHYYACHFGLIFGSLSSKTHKPFFKFQKTVDGIYARRKLQFSDDYLNSHQLLNSTFRLHFPAYVDPSHGSGVLSTIYLAKSILAKEHQAILNHGADFSNVEKNIPAHLKNIIFDIGGVFSFAYEWFFKIKLAKRKVPYTLIPNRNGSYPLEFNSEQIPCHSNRITLLPETDNLGLKRVSIHWKLTETDIQSGINSFMHFKALVDKTEHWQLNFDVKDLQEKITSALPIGGHQLGSTRMGNSPETSVVDKNCQVHGVNNLFIASSSVFTTNGHANPTLSIVALALRLADHLHAIDQAKS